MLRLTSDNTLVREPGVHRAMTQVVIQGLIERDTRIGEDMGSVEAPEGGRVTLGQMVQFPMFHQALIRHADGTYEPVGPRRGPFGGNDGVIAPVR